MGATPGYPICATAANSSLTQYQLTLDLKLLRPLQAHTQTVKFQPIRFTIPTAQGRKIILAGLLINTNDKEDDVDNLELTEEDFLLASTVVFGFSLTDKMWRT